MDNKDKEFTEEMFNLAHKSELIIADKNKRIAELEKAVLELFELVHKSDLIENKIRANQLYDELNLQEYKAVKKKAYCKYCLSTTNCCDDIEAETCEDYLNMQHVI